MAKRSQTKESLPSAPLAALLAWLMPGLGHWWIGDRPRAIILFIVVTTTFWAGVAVGGVRTVVSERENGPWIAAELCMGPQSLIALKASKMLREKERKDASLNYRAPWPSGDIGVIYAGVAGLLNLLVILDVLARVEHLHTAARPRAPALIRKAARS
ncbi:MAG: hypothetical protein H6819_07260 [Phycisphaerales bacterium]|nr:hypothetical protein [Phycisphaerales bacterium]MCB9857707.1 hypothetical protein [Phycisphaerales bacterium]MCB9864796.1 hypothetical protein [Phycisphaerales bacterium]